MSLFNLAVDDEAVRPPLVGAAVLVVLGALELVTGTAIPPLAFALLIAAVLAAVLLRDLRRPPRTLAPTPV